MPAVHNIGRLFVHKFRYPSDEFPLLARGNTQEVTWPFRAARTWVFRYPASSHGFVLGWWGPALPEEVAVERAISGALIGYTPTRNYDGTYDGEDDGLVDDEEEPARDAYCRCEACEQVVHPGPSGRCPECNELCEP